MKNRLPTLPHPSHRCGWLPAPLAATVLLVLLLPFASAQAQGTRSAPTGNAPGLTKESAADSAVFNSRLTAELFLEVLLGELNQLQGEPGVGYSLLLDAARRTGDPRLFKRAVDIALQSRSGDAALEAANSWRQTLPQSREANRHVLQILLALNRVADTLAPLRADIGLSPPEERSRAIASIPGLYARVSDKKLAANVVEQALAAYQSSSETAATTWAVVGQMRLLANDLDAAFQAARRGQALTPQSPETLWLALELMARRHPEAEALVVSHIERTQNAELRLGLARVMIEQHRLDDAIQQLSALTTQHPQFQQGWLLLGSVLAEKGDRDAAQSAWLKFIEGANTRDPNQQRELAQVFLGLAQIATKRGDDAAAESWLARIDDPRSVSRAQIQRAGILARKGQLPQARQLIADLPGQTPEERRTRLLADVQLLREHQQLAMAHEVLQRALTEEPEDQELLYEQAMLAEKLGRLDEMERSLRSIIARNPKHYHAHNALGYLLADRGIRLDEAHELIVTALKQAPDDPFITDSLGWVEFKQGRLAQALSTLQRAYQTRSDPEIAAHLGEVMWALGQRDQAIQVWRKALKFSPDNATLLETLKRLRVTL